MNQRSFGVSLTQPQRVAIAELLPQLVDRLMLEVKRQVKIEFTVSMMKTIWWSAGEAIPIASSGARRNSLRCIIAAFRQAIQDAYGIATIPPSKRLYQFKITLLNMDPVIWRRIQIKNCSVDKLHECIQTALGWTNSHLHQFEIQGIVCGDPELLCGDSDCFVGTNSLKTMVSDIVPQSGARFRFSYEYDFGDRWEHEVVFEGCLPTDQGVRYPLCVEGERACPPEDVGGVYGYAEFLAAIADASHEEHKERMAWAGGDFDPNRFDATAATKDMQRGLPDWRQLERQREPLACR